MKNGDKLVYSIPQEQADNIADLGLKVLSDEGSLDMGLSLKLMYEKAVNIKQRQAYKYIEVYEKFTEDFLKENSKLGITKLLLLSNLTEEVAYLLSVEKFPQNGIMKTAEGVRKWRGATLIFRIF